MSAPLKFILRILLSLVTLIVIDMVVGSFVGGYSIRSDGLERYFSYGVSTSEKLKIVADHSDSLAPSIAHAGWNSELPMRESAADPKCSKNITVYGMSFANRIGAAAKDADACVSLRLIAGPGAPLSHSYFMFERFEVEDDASVVVLAVLASALPKINGVAHFTSAFEAPSTHMYPRYSLEGGKIHKTLPPAATLSEFRVLLHETPYELKRYLAENDDFYSPLVHSWEWADRSMVLRMLRRAYGQKFKREQIDRFFAQQSGLTNESEQLSIARALIENFSRKVSTAGGFPVVLLINDRGYSGALDVLIEGEASFGEAIVLSSSDIVDSLDSSSFLPDGHFTADLDRRLARQFLAALYEKGIMQ